MPHQKREFIEGEPYHLILRGNAGENIFIDKTDFFRGIFSLFEFNDQNPVDIRQRRERKNRRGRPPADSENQEKQEYKEETYKRERLVDILAFCLMPNHVHLLATPIQEGGITAFMSKFAPGYASYYKNRHEINVKGHFYQDRFHAVHVKTDAQLKAVFVYIHTNPVSLIYPGWKEGAKIDAGKALEYCINYKWSSLMDYLGMKNFPSVTQRGFLSEVMGGAKGCRKEIREWLQHKEDMIEEHKHLLIE